MSKYAERAEAENLTKKVLTAEDAFLLVGSMQLFKHIRDKEPETYKLLLKDCDSCLTPSDLSKKAKLYTDRLAKSDPMTHTYVARPQNPRNEAKTECFQFKRSGTCPRADCPYYHDARRVQKEQPAASNDRAPRPGYGRKKKPKNKKSAQVNQVQQTANETPSIAVQSHVQPTHSQSGNEVFLTGV